MTETVTGLRAQTTTEIATAKIQTRTAPGTDPDRGIEATKVTTDIIAVTETETETSGAAVRTVGRRTVIHPKVIRPATTGIEIAKIPSRVRSIQADTGVGPGRVAGVAKAVITVRGRLRRIGVSDSERTTSQMGRRRRARMAT